MNIAFTLQKPPKKTNSLSGHTDISVIGRKELPRGKHYPLRAG